MIHLSTQDGIREFHKEQANRILGNYNRDVVEKGLTIEQFIDQYPLDEYQVYSPSAIGKFLNDFSKSEDADDEILNQNLSQLHEVFIKGDNGESINVFVRKIEEQEG